MPSPSARQNYMKVHMGKTPSVDSNDVIDDIAFKFNILNKTADYTVLASESGSMFTNVGDANAIAYTLPAPADGLIYWFYMCADYEMSISAATAGTMVSYNDATCDAVTFTQATEHIGNGCMIFSDGTMWYVCACLATEDASMVITSA